MNVRLFLLSFLILFLELTLIRWIPAYVRLVSYFSNIILLGSFLGIGLGVLMARKKITLLPLFPLILLGFTALIRSISIEVNVAADDALFFNQLSYPVAKLAPEIILPILCLMVAAVFLPLSQEVGRLFQKMRPLSAYSIDIAGALFGIIVFTFLSYFHVNAGIWFLIIAIVTCTILLPITQGVRRFAVIALMAITVAVAGVNDTAVWSPYYALTITKQADSYQIYVNGIIHQDISNWQERELFYYTPYDIFPHAKFENILVIGAGNGVDVAVALARNKYVKHVDAVEIDPIIVDIGKKLNPNKPFDDPRVDVHITDGRYFLETTTKKYDLIIFALTDSILAAAPTTNIRLESFLFTNEAFAKARDRLDSDGLLVFYNFYRESWLIDKIAGSLEDTFGYPPYVLRFGGRRTPASIFTGPITTTLATKSTLRPYEQLFSLPTASDDWPFVYLKTRAIAPLYVKFLAVLLVLSALVVLSILPRRSLKLADYRFFFFGAAFLLLETKSLVNFGLLFGMTWVVNALVFGGILISILLANVISMSLKLRARGLAILYILLFVTLGIQYLVTPTAFITLPEIIRYTLASILYFSPIFFANILFSQYFRQTHDADLAFGINLLGAVVGGILEYSSLIIGYRNLIIVIALCYVLSLLPRNIKRIV